MRAQNSATTAINLNKIRAAFMQRASAPHILPIAFKLAWLIAYRYMNKDTGTAYPPQDRLARDLNVSVRTVQRLLDILQPLGLGIAPGDGRGRASTYWLDPVTAKGTERATPMSSFQAQKGDKKGRHLTSKKGDTHVAPTLIENQETPSRDATHPLEGAGERARASRADDSLLGGHPPANAGARQALLPLTATPPAGKESKRPSEEESYELAARAEPNSASELAERESCDDWRELRALWRRGHASDDTPKALAVARALFAKACREAAPGDILEGARAWLEAADAPRYLPPLATWLNAKGWTKPPPTKPKRQARAGNGSGSGQHRSNGYAKPDMFKICLEAGGYREDADGNMVWPGDDDEPINTSTWSTP